MDLEDLGFHSIGAASLQIDDSRCNCCVDYFAPFLSRDCYTMKPMDCLLGQRDRQHKGLDSELGPLNHRCSLVQIGS